jgi:hypothetical protein
MCAFYISIMRWTNCLYVYFDKYFVLELYLIYLIKWKFLGGKNDQLGALIKCEKFSLKDRKSTPINFLNVRSSHHTICNFNNNYIYKFGGLRFDLEGKYELN